MSYTLIRKMLPTDFEALVELDNLIWNETNAPASIHWSSIEEFAKHHDRDQLVAVIDGIARGYISYKPPIPLPSNHHVLEFSIGIHPIAQGQGIGRKLIEALTDYAKNNNIKKLSLRVMGSNKGAIRFYKSCGFIEQGRLVSEFLIKGKYVDDLLMYKLV
jgi:ribosomal protein S18 acetylase RimI-like enzyme